MSERIEKHWFRRCIDEGMEVRSTRVYRDRHKPDSLGNCDKQEKRHLIKVELLLASMACLDEAVGSILGEVSEVKIEIMVIECHAAEFLLRGGYFCRSLFLRN